MHTNTHAKSCTHLVHVARRVVEDAQHGHNPVGAAVGAADVRVRCTHVVDGQADTPGVLGDLGALRKRRPKKREGGSNQSGRFV